MVQYRPDMLYGTAREYKDYWKLTNNGRCSSKDLRRSLQNAGYTFRNNEDRERLLDLQSRADRELLSYQDCDTRDLKKFHKQRGIKTLVRGKDTKGKYIAALEEADDNAAFGHFTDLPAELRLLIYEYHIGAHEDEAAETNGTHPRVPPPITEVSRLIRHESLPIFYERHRLRICFECRFHDDFRIEGPSMTLIEHCDGDLLPRYMKVCLSVSVSGTGRFSWHIDLCAGVNEFKMVHKAYGFGMTSPPKEWLAGTENQLRSILKVVVDREGQSGLLKEDLDEFMGVLNAAKNKIGTT
ncbi:hypothetical protein CLAFUW4_01843 [Fulvia fulva]|uniref:Uncharacterized protein n=1 Tax=Passalora fulva TaxID=5499 RepID=A0A9Q8L598_PASFU|nr:uncharacterized protein CLAFUR5_01838 [Fulvia fulva]KAK4635432.1 hypothetical protein CLAFUR4_01838 [Fulvia fulva]KAK4638042.1 hypothetical protein CLAFUR0_01840 [Fulvia fulva]UJO11052.1 hypothetical protein CLAFUR5_01838 [Fulvia fulva]WPV09885.1 hypothetical protein CLAFUW4_01843 [Fulvia fulva]WPV25285.1 hypothetical protein CLAFUW7_01842 [Fulvia fulva]